MSTARGAFPYRLVAGSLTLLVAATGACLSAESAGAQAAPSTRPTTVTVGSNPLEIAIAPSRSEAYVLNDGSVSVVSLQTHREVAEIGTGFHDQTAIGLVGGGTRAYIGTFDEPVLKILDTEKRTLVRSVTMGYGATGIASVKTAKGGRAYVSLLTDKSVAVLRTSNATLLRKIHLPRGPQTVTATPNDKSVWVGSSYSGRIWKIDTTRQRVVGHVNVLKSGPVTSIVFTSDSKLAWVSGPGGISEVSVQTGKILAFVPTPRLFPHVQDLNLGEIALNKAGTALLAVNSTFPDAPAKGQLSVLDTRTLKVGRVIPLGTEPQGIALDQKRGTTYVTNYMDDTVSWFRTPR
jgi:DNA-binding beta-propeller fold protein YncE